MKTDYVVTRRVRNRYLVRERDRRRLRELLQVTLAIAVVGGALIGYTWLHLEVVRRGYRVERLEGRLGELERIERHLRLEEAYLTSPQRLERAARQRLGMRPPELGDVEFVASRGGDGEQ